jgi:hypothetical protein
VSGSKGKENAGSHSVQARAGPIADCVRSHSQAETNRYLWTRWLRREVSPFVGGPFSPMGMRSHLCMPAFMRRRHNALRTARLRSKGQGEYPWPLLWAGASNPGVTVSLWTLGSC